MTKFELLQVAQKVRLDEWRVAQAAYQVAREELERSEAGQKVSALKAVAEMVWDGWRTAVAALEGAEAEERMSKEAN